MRHAPGDDAVAGVDAGRLPDAHVLRQRLRHAHHGLEAPRLGDAGEAWYINSRSKNPDLGWAFIQAFSSAETQAALATEDPHLPARVDARAIAQWADQPLSQKMLETARGVTLPPPEPQFRKLIEVVQNATGLVATGKAAPEEAIARYGDELTRTMGKTNVISEPCR